MASASEPREECVQTIRSEIPQKTIHQSFCVQGVGLHHGGRVKVTVHPARENQGIFFRVFQNDSWVLVPARSHFVSSSTRCTILASGVGSLSTVEHFLAACWGADVDNLEVVVEGEEMPAGDGSSVFWMDYFTQSGIVEQASPRWYLVVNDWICIQDRNQYLFAFPGPSFSVSYFLDVFENPSFAEYAFFSGNQEFFSTIAAARTFAFQNDVDTILREGLGQGVRESAFVLDDNGQANQFLRMSEEPCYHKLVDMIGDLMLAGFRLRGQFVGLRSGHKLNVRMVKDILKKARIENENRYTSCH